VVELPRSIADGWARNVITGAGAAGVGVVVVVVGVGGFAGAFGLQAASTDNETMNKSPTLWIRDKIITGSPYL
jgi:hypothetical protein